MSVLVNSLPAGAVASPSSHASPRAGVGESILRALVRIGHQRAAGELQRLATCYDGVDKQLACQLRVASAFDGMSH